MKVKLTIEFDVEPEKELTAKEIANVTGMMRRKAQRRLDALAGQRHGGEQEPVGWEVTVNKIEVSGASKVK